MNADNGNLGLKDCGDKRQHPTILVLMGVSGSGKSTIAKVLADWLGWTYKEGDDLHSAAEVAKMRSGHPLNDDDRQPWLDAVANWIDAQQASGCPGIITCSALKRAYRQIIIGDRPGVRLVYFHGDSELLAQRLHTRQGHFMPATLLASQLQTLDPPGPDEHPVTVDIGSTPDEIAAAVLRKLGINCTKEPS